MFEDWHKGHWFAVGLLMIALTLVVILGVLGVIFANNKECKKDCNVSRVDTETVAKDYPACFDPEERIVPEKEVIISYVDREIEIIKEIIKTEPLDTDLKQSNDSSSTPLYTENKFPPHSVENKIMKNDDVKDVLKSLNMRSRHERIPSRAVDAADIMLQKEEEDLLEFLPVILYMNLDPRADYHKEIEAQIQSLHLPENCRLMRLCSEKKKENVWDEFLMHTTAMAKAISLEGHVLILEDTFVLDISRKELLRIFRNLPVRWDVLLFAQDVEEYHPWQDTYQDWIRVLQNNNKCAYLVNEHYFPKLVSTCFKSFRAYNRTKNSQVLPFSLLKVFQGLQKSDLWLGQKEAIGHERAGQRESLDTDKKCKFLKDGTQKTVKVHPVVYRRKVAICTVAKGEEENRAMEILFKDIHSNFLKMHHLEVFLYTDNMEFFHDMDKDIELHKIHLTHEVPSPFHLVWNIQDMLKAFDYIFYMDSHYRIIDVIDWDLNSIQSLCAVEDLVNICQPKQIGQKHVGSPELNPESKAYIRPEEEMQAYYSDRLWGGKRSKVLEVCNFILEAAAEDQQKKIIVRKGFESYFNRYLLSHLPSLSLSVSYNFPEQYMDPHCRDNLCKRFKEHHIRPIMTWKA